jgi:hypothetical protein
VARAPSPAKSFVYPMTSPLLHNAVMPAQIVVGETDDPYFIELANRVVVGVLVPDEPENVWIIQIDNWFDHKWLKFSGNGALAAPWRTGVSNRFMDRFDTVKVESYQEKVTFPPFTPNRVLGQWSYQRVGSEYSEFPSPRLPHQTSRQHSEMNLRNRIQDFSRSALFVWYSSNTVATGRGSMMLYKVFCDAVECWFISFKRALEWKVVATKGISQSAVQALLVTT